MNYNDVEVLTFKSFVMGEYHYNLYLDGLPAAVRLRNKETGELELNYEDGIPVGFLGEEN